MKKLIFSSLFAMLMLVLCQNEMVHAQEKSTATKAILNLRSGISDELAQSFPGIGL